MEGYGWFEWIVCFQKRRVVSMLSQARLEGLEGMEGSPSHHQMLFPPTVTASYTREKPSILSTTLHNALFSKSCKRGQPSIFAPQPSTWWLRVRVRVHVWMRDGSPIRAAGAKGGQHSTLAGQGAYTDGGACQMPAHRLKLHGSAEGSAGDVETATAWSLFDLVRRGMDIHGSHCLRRR